MLKKIWQNRKENMKIINRVITGMVGIAICTMIISIVISYMNTKGIIENFLGSVGSITDSIVEESSIKLNEVSMNTAVMMLKKEGNRLDEWMVNSTYTLEVMKKFIEDWYAEEEMTDEEPLTDYTIAANQNNAMEVLLYPQDFEVKNQTVFEKEKMVVNELYELLPLAASGISNFTITFKDGFSLSYDTEKIDYTGIDFRTQKWYKDAIEEDDDLFWKAAYTNQLGQTLITCTTSIYDLATNEVIGVAKVELEMTEFINTVKETKIFDDDITLMMKDNGKFVCSPDKFNEYSLSKEEKEKIVEAFLSANNQGEEIFTVELSNDNAYTFFIYEMNHNKNWNLCIGIGEKYVNEHIKNLYDTAEEDKNTYIESINIITQNSMKNFFNTFTFIGACAFVLAIYLSVQITRPLVQVTEEANKIADGNLESRLTVNGDNEAGQLARVINHMLDQIKLYISDMNQIVKERERINTELEIATHIQENMLPDNYLDHEKFEIAAYMVPAKEVGGDFYDFFTIDENHVFFVVADVSGKGVPAALFMAIGKTLIREHALRESDLGKVFYEVNNLLCDVNKDGNFITAFAAIIDLETGDMQYVNAGHEKPLIRKSNGAYEMIEIKPNFVLAAVENMTYEAERLTLEKGSVIFEYTDGIPEANNSAGQLYGLEQLHQSLNQHNKLSGKELINATIDDMNAYVDGADQFDDTTILTLLYK